MQKALLLALLFGAFLFSTYIKADDQAAINQLKCVDLGGTFQTHPELGDICSTPAPYGSVKICYGPTVSPTPVSDMSQCAEIGRPTVSTAAFTCSHSDYAFVYSDTRWAVGYEGYSKKNNSCTPGQFRTNVVEVYLRDDPPQYYCPPDNDPKLTSFSPEGEGGICFAYAPEDIPEEPECDDIVGNCEEPDPFECFLTSSGSEVCFADPNEKCDVESVNGEPVFSNCSAGCGFVNDNFVCADKPDLPNLDDCLVTTNGYACPSDTPPPDDNIDDPTKPLPDMQKHDFKDVLKGVETRLNNTNQLMKDQIARDKDNTNKLAGKLDVGNKALKAIEDHTGSAAKSLREGLYGDALEIEDDSGSILSGLGLTGEESITDLEKGTVSLSDYRDQFTWSAGSSACPAPRSMNILNNSFSIDWQPYCDAFGVIGYFVKAAALFLSGFIAFGVRK